jgi:hypothetical protein
VGHPSGVADAASRDDVPSPAYHLHVLPWLRGPGGRVLVHGWLAITIGDHIWAWRDLDTQELAHELCHVRQWRRYGARFIPRYMRASWRAWQAGADPYRDNAFEVAARRAAAAAGEPLSRPQA